MAVVVSSVVSLEVVWEQEHDCGAAVEVWGVHFLFGGGLVDYSGKIRFINSLCHFYYFVCKI